MIQLAAVAFALLLGCGASVAQEAPRFAVFVTNENQDVFVAIYGHAAVELSGCVSVSEARTLIQLPSDSPLEETTLAVLESNFGYGTFPRIPCAAAAFDIDWPATTPIWADVQGSGNYLIAATSGDGFVAIPARCNTIKTALAIRERLQLPGVLQATTAPPGGGDNVLVLDCGTAVTQPNIDVGEGVTTAWSLHRFETFLSEDSTGDTIYAIRYVPPGDGAVPAYLPVVRADGQETRDVILAGGAAMLELEAAISQLIGAAADTPVTTLGAEAVSPLRNALQSDLCLESCVGYEHHHAAFLQPGIDLGVTALPPLAATTQMDRLGRERLTVEYAEGRQIVLTGCPSLTAALGLNVVADADWLAATATALESDPAPGSGFDCRGASSATCVRKLTGTVLASAHFTPGPDCPGATRLRIELPALVESPQALQIGRSRFEDIELAPALGVGRSRIVIVPSRLIASTSSCVLSQTNALIGTNGLSRLVLSRIDLERKATESAAEVVALQIQDGTLVLDDVTIGGDVEGSAPVQRGVHLCVADLYAAGVRISAESVAIQGLSARVIVSGAAQARSSLARARFGIFMSSNSIVRLNQTDLSSATPVVLRGARLEGDALALTSTNPGAGVASGVQLERGSAARIVISTVVGFRCAASFVDAGSSLTFVLPGNDIARDNTHAACGPGIFSLIE